MPTFVLMILILQIKWFSIKASVVLLKLYEFKLLQMVLFNFCSEPLSKFWTSNWRSLVLEATDLPTVPQLQPPNQQLFKVYLGQIRGWFTKVHFYCIDVYS